METSRNEKNKILEVKNLRISFKTNGGTVKAVRGIDFALYRGKVLAIVGESGSGKSVTSKAILGILANNKIIEDGQIIFDGKDLLKLSEDEFTKIRGVKISMIFQDPLSSLDPIITVGKQLTEAMVLKNKASRKEASAFIRKGIREGKVMESKTLETAGTPVDIRLTPDRARIHRDGQDLSFILIEAIDAEGRTVPIADNALTVRVSGAASFLALGNADIKDEDAYTDTSHRMWKGRALLVIRSNGKKGKANIRVTLEGMNKTRGVQIQTE